MSERQQKKLEYIERHADIAMQSICKSFHKDIPNHLVTAGYRCGFDDGYKYHMDHLVEVLDEDYAWAIYNFINEWKSGKYGEITLQKAIKYNFKFLNMDKLEKIEDFLSRMQGLIDNAKKRGHIIVRVEDLENTFPELRESNDEEKPNGGIVLEDFNEGDGFYKINLAYLSKEQVEEIENTVKKWYHKPIESEDEKIRKAIIEFFELQDDNTTYSLIPKKDIIAWLEEQDKKDKLIKELGEYKVKYTQEVIEKHINSRSNKDDERLRKTTIAFLKDFAEQGYENAVECIDWLKKQDERKPTDKVKPKFKVGDWVIDKQNIVHQIANVIENVTNHTYGYDIVGGGYFNDNTEGVRLWTIQDAKDGDVLVCDINKAEIGGDVEKLPNTVSTIFIFKNVVSSRDYIHSYCHLYDRHVLGVQNTMYYNSFVYNIHPATKEQRDILFQKVEEAGYNWDSDKVAQSSIKEIGYDKEI